jgi:hypothetical protein
MPCLPVQTRLRALPLPSTAILGLLLLCAADAMSAQTRASARPQPAAGVQRGDRITVRAGTALRSTPGGEVIGVSSRAITGPAELVQSSFVRITIDGFLATGAVRLTGDRTRGEVGGASGATLRATASASGAAIAELRRTAYVFPMRAGGTFPTGRTVAFLPVRRSLWVDVSRVTGGRSVAATPRAAAPAAERAGATSASAARGAAPPPAARESAAAAPTAPPAESVVVAPPSPVSGPTLETLASATVRTGPGGEVLATLPGGVPVTSLARENGWVRVRIEGWLPDSSVGVAGARSAASLSAADLRANPAGTVGRLVRWSVEALAFQTADALRQGLAPGERYLLARGPGTERAVLYLAVPDSLAAVAQALPPLAEISITARVRSGRSQPSGVPILDLIELTRR